MIVIDGQSEQSIVHLVLLKLATQSSDNKYLLQSTCETDEGISKYIDRPKGVADSLLDCIHRLCSDQSVSTDGLPVYLAGTQDMRVQELTKASALYEQIQQELLDAGLKPRSIGTLGEVNELCCSWLSANHFSEDHKVGVVDLGNSFERMAYELQGSNQPSAYGTSNTLSIFGKDHTIYTYSSLCAAPEQAHLQ